MAFISLFLAIALILNLAFGTNFMYLMPNGTSNESLHKIGMVFGEKLYTVTWLFLYNLGAFALAMPPYYIKWTIKGIKKLSDKKC